MIPDFTLQSIVWTTVILFSEVQSDLQSVYDWAHSNNMVFNSGKFNHLCFSASSDMSVCSNAYISPEMNLIAQHEHIKDLGVSCLLIVHLITIYL